VFVLPCRVTEQGDRDGIPVALMEAMASGAPAVSTVVSGIPELIQDQVNGLLVAPDDPDALAAAIDQVLSDPAAAVALARQGRETIEQDFDVSREAGKLLGLFESRMARSVVRTGEQVA
jgi:glycosyltransferase involved in cell wall biosynthesis